MSNLGWGCGWKERKERVIEETKTREGQDRKSTASPCSSILAAPVASTWEEVVARDIVSVQERHLRLRNSQAVNRSPKDGLGRKRSRQEAQRGRESAHRERAGLSLRKQGLWTLLLSKKKNGGSIARIWVVPTEVTEAERGLGQRFGRRVGSVDVGCGKKARRPGRERREEEEKRFGRGCAETTRVLLSFEVSSSGPSLFPNRQPLLRTTLLRCTRRFFVCGKRRCAARCGKIFLFSLHLASKPKAKCQPPFRQN